MDFCDSILNCVLFPLRQIRGYIGSRNVRKAVKAGRSLRIVVGTSGRSMRGWISTDVQYLNLLQPDKWASFFREDSIDAILAEHVWEHLTRDEGVIAARTCHRFLKPGGYIRVAVPDGLHPDPSYIKWVCIGGTGGGAHDHKVLYHRATLGDVLKEAGFKVRPLEYFDSEGRFHFVEWNSEDGMIRRSSRFDKRNRERALCYTSLILDAIKETNTDS